MIYFIQFAILPCCHGAVHHVWDTSLLYKAYSSFFLAVRSTGTYTQANAGAFTIQNRKLREFILSTAVYSNLNCFQPRKAREFHLSFRIKEGWINKLFACFKSETEGSIMFIRRVSTLKNTFNLSLARKAKEHFDKYRKVLNKQRKLIAVFCSNSTSPQLIKYVIISNPRRNVRYA